MIGALRYEWLRITTIRSTYWLSGIAILLSAGIALILSLVIGSADSSGELGDLAGSGTFTTYIVTAGVSGPIMPVLAAVFFAVMGSMATGHEYRYGTAKATLTAIPNRFAVLAAKALVLIAWVVATSVLILLLNFLIAWLFVDSAGLDGDSVRPMAFFVLYCVGFALAGYALSTIFRNQVGAIVAVLVWPLVLEPIVFTILRATLLSGSGAGIGKVANLLPASAGRRTLFRPYEVFSDFDLSAQSTVWGLGASSAVFWIGVLGLVAAGTALFVTRDA